ncbi:MAG TPA: methylaspartate mutase subunit E [Pyrinomonadaceae bacterium]|nr:methylaspartate mutase subunit E [Pyrinomonadaceae bacterium]
MFNKRPYTILLGGLGGDSHSVGLTILRQSLLANGYQVNYLGTQNTLADFFQTAGLTNLVMISSMDGHARYYLREFFTFKREFKTNSTLWYLGGNLGVSEGGEREFIEMGFNRVFVKFVELTIVLNTIERDLEGVEAVANYPERWKQSVQASCSSGVASDELLEHETFESRRREVLEHWKTGNAARNLASNAQFLMRQPSFPKAQTQVKMDHGQILIQPRCGVALIGEQIRLFKNFKRAGVKVLSYQVDSLTRNNNYAGAEEIIRDSRLSGTSTLNGFPVINHGVTGLRRIAQQVHLPLQTRHSARDPRLLAEISYAGGVTSFEGGAISYNIPYYKNYPLAESIRNWQYVDYLTGLHHKLFGVVLDREFFGTLTATLIPPCLAIVTNVIEALLAVRQGVKCVSLGYAEQGHRSQDIAAIRMMKKMTSEILDRMGYKDVQLNTVFHQYMAAFPPCLKRADELIRNSAITAARSGATRIMGKTLVEAFGIPTLTDNITGIELIRSGLAGAADCYVDEARVAEECAAIRREVEAIFESVVLCGNGDIAQGVVTGFKEGLMDIPFSSSIHNRGEAMTMRDVEGAVRFLSTGNLRLDRESREFHQHKVNERRKAEGARSCSEDHRLVERDVTRIVSCRYERWPLGQ